MYPTIQNYIAFLKLFSAIGFIILILEISQYYDGYRVHASHLAILKVIAFAWFLILLIVLGLAGASVVATTLLRRINFEAPFMAMVEVMCVTILGITFVGALTATVDKYYLPVPANNHFYHNYWVEYRVVPFAILALVIYTQLSGTLRRWLNNVIELLRIPCLSLSVGSLIWVGPSFITFCFTELKGVENNGNKPNVFLITFDSLNARDMSLYGYHRKTTPYMEEFARESFVFKNMHSNCPSTSIALTSILTAKYPWTHGAKDSDNLTVDLSGCLTTKIESIATALSKEYYTVAVASLGRYIAAQAQFDRVQGDKAQGIFGAFLNECCGNGFRPTLPPLPQAPLIFGGERPPPFVGAMQCLERLKQRPFLIWIHVLPPHEPYSPPSPFLGTFLPGDEVVQYQINKSATYEELEQPIVDKLRARYDELILYADACLHSFIEGLKEKGLYDNSLIIITSDHGESFQRGYLLHGRNPQLPEAEIHIPLLIHFPGQSHGNRISALAEQVDLAPTILDFLGKPIPSWMEGESLLPYMHGKISDRNTVPYSKNGETGVLFKGYYKMVRLPDGAEKLYNLKKDPEELENLFLKEPDIAAQLRELIRNPRETSKVAN